MMFAQELRGWEARMSSAGKDVHGSGQVRAERVADAGPDVCVLGLVHKRRINSTNFALLAVDVAANM